MENNYAVLDSSLILAITGHYLNNAHQTLKFICNIHALFYKQGHEYTLDLPKV